MLLPADPVNAFVDYADAPVPNAPDGPLAGLTFAVKDIFDVAGYPTGCGNPVKRRESGTAKAHAPAVARLLKAGARFVGKTHTAELAFSIDGRNAHYGTPLNPAAPGRVPGGSSSGSAAAVAAGLVDFALGSDTGGSVRAPASFCGVIGLRPTQDRVDIGGAMPLAPSYDTVGWFARDIGTFERVGAVLLRTDGGGPPLRRMILAEDALVLLFGEAEQTALRPGVAAVSAVLGPAETVTLAPDGLSVWANTYRTLQGFEAWQVHGPWLSSRDPQLGPQTATRFEAARNVTAGEAEVGRVERAEIRKRLRQIVGEDGVLVQPTTPGIALPVDAPEAVFEAFRGRAMALNCIAGHAGLPQVTLPVGTVDGCPLGLSLTGPAGRDRALLALAAKVLARMGRATAPQGGGPYSAAL